ncbi:hypothetical protein ACTMTJ_12015 [Phytohabitans sp. LJ34]|uniref:hypothetical protein n=1 Tax=Phytohabitans sp. LJ34 TaxID=3452217 RepID=UPI003F8AEC87
MIRRPWRRRIKPDEAERLLAGRPDTEHPELGRLLAAAAAPPRPEELTGLDSALAAFEEAGRVERPAPAPRRRHVLRPLAAAAAVSVLLVGGVAVAAETGYLPGTGPPAKESLAPREVPSSAARTSPGGGATSGPAPTPSPTASGPTAGPADKTAARLCRQWDDRRVKGKPMKPKDLAELARLAGGEPRIPGFCAPLLPPTPTESPKHPDKKKGGPPTSARPPSVTG